MRFTVSRHVAAGPDAAWELLTSTRAWTRWGPSVTAVEPADAVVFEGLVGRVRTPVGLWLPFRITALVPGHSWAWSVLGIPATSHQVEAEPGGSRVTFGVPGPALPYLLVCRLALRRIAAALEAGPGHQAAAAR
jgi:uncharacterized protein YndB with AHSA1/START domain